MNKNPFQRSTSIVLILLAITLSVPVIFIGVTTQSAIISGDLMKIPGFMILFLSGILFLFCYICSIPIIQLMTKYTDNGIQQLSVTGWKFLAWNDVKEIQNITTGNIILIGSKTKIYINPFLFTNPQNLLAEIRLRIPESSYPSENQANQEIIHQKRNDARRSAIGTFIAAILIFILGKQLIPTMIFGLLIIMYALFETRRWIKYNRELK